MYLQVIDDVTLVGRYCGTSQPPVITSSSKTLEIRFEYNGGAHVKGFKAYYAETGEHVLFIGAPVVQ